MMKVNVFDNEIGDYTDKEFSVDAIVDAGLYGVNKVLGTDMNLKAASKVYDKALIAKYGKEQLKQVETNFGATGYGKKYVLKNEKGTK